MLSNLDASRNLWMITLSKVVIRSTELLTFGRRRVTRVKMTSAPSRSKCTIKFIDCCPLGNSTGANPCLAPHCTLQNNSSTREDQNGMCRGHCTASMNRVPCLSQRHFIMDQLFISIDTSPKTSYGTFLTLYRNSSPGWFLCVSCPGHGSQYFCKPGGA